MNFIRNLLSAKFALMLILGVLAGVLLVQSSDGANDSNPIVHDRIEPVAESVNFELLFPGETAGLELVGANLNGAEDDPVAEMHFSSRNDPVRKMVLAQVDGSFGEIGEIGPSERMVVQGNEAILQSVKDEQRTLTQIQWKANGIEYLLGGINIDAPELMEVAESLRPVN